MGLNMENFQCVLIFDELNDIDGRWVNESSWLQSPL